MDERSTGRKGTPLPIYVGGPSGRRVPRRKSYSRRGSRSQSSDDVSPSKKSFVLIEGRMWKVLWALFLVAFVICVACLLILGHTVQDGKFSNTDVTAGKGGIFSAWRDNQMLAKLEPLSSMFTSVEDAKVKYQITKEQLRNLGDYECIGWRQTRNCTPSGERDVENDRNCSALISNGVSGYCEVRNTRTGETNHVMQMHCDSLRIGVRFRCNMFQTLLSYSILSTDYEHDPNFSYPHNQEVFRATNKLSNTPIPLGNDGLKNESVGQLQLSFDRGIVMVVYEKLLLGAYVSVRSLRALGCTLPIEMWYKSSETSVEHPLLRHMVDELNVYLRVIEDPLATHFYTKLYALFYSAFDNVLLLDADNFAVRDPTYLFDTLEFLETGAIFWPDFWQPSNSMFNIHGRSFVWDLFGLEFVDSFEQESGQVLINRRMHGKAMNILMFYGFSLPRVYQEMRLVWGDKDLFRFAWLKSESSFYMVPGPPGSAGTKHTAHDLFCGLTMIQYDSMGRIMFLHRNTEKLMYGNVRLLWTHIQEYKRTAAPKDHIIRGDYFGERFPQFKRCYGKDEDYDKLFTLKPMSAFPFENIEKDLLRYATEGVEIVKHAGYTKQK